MKIIITGGTGFIGSNLSKALIKRGDEVFIFTRNPEKGVKKIPGADYIKWDYNKPGEWQQHLNGKDVIIHLAGTNLSGQRWTKEYKKILWDSRIKSGDNLVNAIKNVSEKPQLFISASGVNYYGDKGDELLTEESNPGDDFLARLCIEWENTPAKTEALGLRRVSIRTAAVLSPDEGALQKLLIPFRLFVGGPLGRGDQWFPWIHPDDVVRAYLFAIDNSLLKGAVNVSSPNPVTMNEFASVLGKVLKRPDIFKVPGFILDIAVGEMAVTVKASIKAIPKKLMENNFEFKFKDLELALRDLLNK